MLYEESREKRRRLEYARRQLELMLWFAVAALIALVSLSHRWDSTQPLVLTGLFAPDLLWALIPFLGPIVFHLIFEKLPLAALRDAYRARRDAPPPPPPGPVSINVQIGPQPERILEFDEMAKAPAAQLLAYFASSSRRLARSLFTRAGVYLFIGVMVAFSGLIFFYTQTTDISRLVQQTDLFVLVQYAPKFGILFFIELVAFFFLRQYRSAMDEFRHFEDIQRRREETLVLMRIAEVNPSEVNLSDLLAHIRGSSSPRLDTGQTTELLESRKLEKNEIALLEKVIEAVTRKK